MTPSGGSRTSGPKASKDTAGFHGSKGVSAHLPKLRHRRPDGVATLGQGEVVQSAHDFEVTGRKEPVMLGDEHGKGCPERNPDEEVGLDRLGRVEGQRTSASSRERTCPPSGP